MIIKSADLDAAATYKLLIGSVVPRAIAWVSTVSTAGVGNIAPVSFFTVVGRKPPMVSLSLQPRSDGKTLKDTFLNIRDTGEFVINVATLHNAHFLHKTAFEFDSATDEFDAVGLEKADCEVVRAPRIKSAPISFECVVDRIMPVGDMQDHVVWGEVVRFHIRDDLYLERGRVDTAALSPVGRLAAEYTLVENVFTTPLDSETLVHHHGRRMARLDGQSTDFSPVDTAAWSASGATR